MSFLFVEYLFETHVISAAPATIFVIIIIIIIIE